MTDSYDHIPTPVPVTGPTSTSSHIMGHGGEVTHPHVEVPQPYQLSSASSYANLQYLFGAQNPAMIAPKGTRNRRKSNQGPDHIKHRRTRSGCYTCRSRRVKCDEIRPTCERCRKGGRECIYPEAPKLAKSASSNSSKTGQLARHETPDSTTDDSEGNDESERPDTNRDGSGGSQDTHSTHSARSPSKPRPRRGSSSQMLDQQTNSSRVGSETPSLMQDKGSSPTPSSEGSVTHVSYVGISNMNSKRQPASSSLRSDWSHLPQDLQFYLSYFYENVTYHHYALKHDSGDFLRTTFLDAALRNDALLHAVVGFAAFQRTLHIPGGQIQDFLQYYNKAVSLLLKSLKRGERHTMGTLLTVLQLATIEEYLGDWVNLLGHQKAAYEILVQLYTPRTIMETNLTQMVFGWYARFDVFASLMGGFELVLSKDWFTGTYEYYARKVVEEPENINWRIQEAIGSLKLIAMEMSMLFAKMGKGEIALEQFMAENELVRQRISDWKTKMDPALQDPRWHVTDFTGARPVDPNDIVDPYIPGTLFHGPLWSMNVTMIDWYSVDLMHKYRSALTLQSQPSKELAMGAFATCQLFEAIEYWPDSPKGSVVACQASLAIAGLFLPRDRTHTMWCRRKLATVEVNGYIYPLTFRTKMAQLFQDQSCMDWWLPNDENYPPIIRSIRKFVEDRTTQARDLPTEDLRDMKAIFSAMKLDDDEPSPPHPPAISLGYVEPRGSEPRYDQSAFSYESVFRPEGTSDTFVGNFGNELGKFQNYLER